MFQNKCEKAVRMPVASLEWAAKHNSNKRRLGTRLDVCNLPVKNYMRGFTLIEILVVAAIITIAAMIAIPMMSSASGMQIRSAANMLAADLEYAKSMAISRQRNYSVLFNTTAESYQIFEEQSGTLVAIAHPVKKGFDYVIDFRNDSRVNRVDISSVDFNSEATITFDTLGSPYSGTGVANPLNSGTISLQAGNFSITVNVEPVTGFISIE